MCKHTGILRALHLRHAPRPRTPLTFFLVSAENRALTLWRLFCPSLRNTAVWGGGRLAFGWLVGGSGRGGMISRQAAQGKATWIELVICVSFERRKDENRHDLYTFSKVVVTE